MRLRIFASTAGLFCMGLVSVAQAENQYDRGLYAGVGLELLRADIRGTDNGNDFNVTALPLELIGRVGYHFLPWLAVEGFGGFGIHDDPNDGKIGGGTTVRDGDTQLNYHFGAAVKPQYAVVFRETTQISFYALAGYSVYDLEGEASNNNNANLDVDFSRDDNDYYYGAGIQIDGEAASFNLQYVEYARGRGLDLEGYQVSINRYF